MKWMSMQYRLGFATQPYVVLVDQLVDILTWAATIPYECPFINLNQVQTVDLCDSHAYTHILALSPCSQLAQSSPTALCGASAIVAAADKIQLKAS
jgi:hypothetical protein